jgi:hypothetical protein
MGSGPLNRVRKARLRSADPAQNPDAPDQPIALVQPDDIANRDVYPVLGNERVTLAVMLWPSSSVASSKSSRQSLNIAPTREGAADRSRTPLSRACTR